jgi:hypothetical protein
MEQLSLPLAATVPSVGTQSNPRYRLYAEVAAELRLPVRTLRELVRRHRPPVLKAGKRVLFDDVAIADLVEKLRCPSKSSNAPKPDSCGSWGPSSASALEKALALTTRSSRKNAVLRAKLRSIAG